MMDSIEQDLLHPTAPVLTALKVVVAIPTLNEEASIEACIRDLRRTSGNFVNTPILVVDGGSSDRTREIVLRIARTDRNVRLLHNPARVQSAAVNRAAREAQSLGAERLLRVDAHAGYPPDYVASLDAAMTETGAQSVVVVLHSVGLQGFSRALAAVSNGAAGSGDSVHRIGGASGWVDHGHHALFELEAFLASGGYDESFTHNEDAEFDARLLAAGGRIWLAGDITVDYHVRGSLPDLVKQYRAYGKGRARTCLKLGRVPKRRQLAPILLVLGFAVTPLSGFSALFAVPALAYVVFLVVCTLRLVSQIGNDARYVPLALSGMHIAWGVGFLQGLFVSPKSLRGERPARDKQSSNGERLG